MERTIRTTLAKKNTEMEKLERTKKSHLRMMNCSYAKFKMKHLNTENPANGETEARNIVMYETHFPGFCYLRNGDFRKRTTSYSISSSVDPIECSNKIKAVLFTNNELDIYKTMCLHLLGTHVQHQNHIQRKNGRLCSYVKAQSTGNGINTLQPLYQRVANNPNDQPTKYDKMLPRYVLDITILNRPLSTCSSTTIDLDSESDDELKKKRKLVIPIYINTEIRLIVNSILEALQDVDSSKFNELIELSSSPEALRTMLAKEEIQDYIYELSHNPLVTKPTSYDFVMSHLMFDKIPEKGTLETVAQVLEVHNDSELKNSLQQIRKGIHQRHTELMNSNLIPRKKSCVFDRTNVSEKYSKHSSPTIDSTANNCCAPGSVKPETEETTKKKENFRETTDNEKVKSDGSEKENQKVDEKNTGTVKKKKKTTKEVETEKEPNTSDADENISQGRNSNNNSTDSYKFELHNLNNSDRILLGLKVASLKSRPLNMHQFDGKRKVDLAAILNPIIRPQGAEVDFNTPENHLRNFAIPEERVKKPCNSIPLVDFENLTRVALANFRLDISEAENKKRINQFMSKI